MSDYLEIMKENLKRQGFIGREWEIERGGGIKKASFTKKYNKGKNAKDEFGKDIYLIDLERRIDSIICEMSEFLVRKYGSNYGFLDLNSIIDFFASDEMNDYLQRRIKKNIEEWKRKGKPVVFGHGLRDSYLRYLKFVEGDKLDPIKLYGDSRRNLHGFSIEWNDEANLEIATDAEQAGLSLLIDRGLYISDPDEEALVYRVVPAYLGLRHYPEKELEDYLLGHYPKEELLSEHRSAKRWGNSDLEDSEPYRTFKAATAIFVWAVDRWYRGFNNQYEEEDFKFQPDHLAHIPFNPL